METKNEIFRPFVTDETTFEEISNGIIGENKDSYFDYTASGLAYRPIEERLQEVLSTYANTHSEFAGNAKATSFNYDIARENLKKYLGLTSDFVIFPCGSGATGAIKKFQELLGLYIPPATKNRFKINVDDLEKPLILVGPFEHHSNEISYREALCDIIRIPLNVTGNVDLEFLENTLKENSEREIIGAFSTASNVTGIVSPYKEISKLLRQYNATVAFDSAASSPCMSPDSELFDALFLSPHKLLGGPGSCGLLAIRRSLIDSELSPTFAGGGTVAYVSKDEHFFNSDIEVREDAGTPPILQLIKASFAYQLRYELGLDRIQARKSVTFRYLEEELAKLDEHTIYGQTDIHDSIGIIAINFHGVTPFDLCEKLSVEYGIQTRAGCSCAGPYGQDLFGITESNSEKEKPSWLRISLNYTHSKENIKYLIDALRVSVKELKEK
ncbi:aminotransferase class V-fold PLP-dependent enzyme [Arcobacteraceae bacterium]|jgi:selenocysteine lyase/cysteine desulfurase|nr:aminotransferase class V-fold PLP-dependent enzyme [Arcobacteraceae bacterium]